MKNILILLSLLLLTAPAFGQSTAEQVQPGTLQVVGGHSKFVPLSTTNPLPVSVSIGTSGIACPSCSNGQLLIGNASTGSFGINTLTAGSGITVTNGPGTITLSASGGGGGTVTSIATTSPITGGTITTTGTIACATCGVTGTGLGQFASTTSAQLAGVISDETGTGVAVFGTAPTFTTSITDPLIIGGTGAGSSHSIQSTSGVGTTDFINFLVGNNGATEAMRINTSGAVSIGTTTSFGSKFNVGGGVSVGTSYVGTAAPTNGAIIQGNVAIGTSTSSTSPAFTLQVNANGSYTGSTGTGGLALTNATVPSKELYMGYDSTVGTNGSGYIQSVNAGVAYTNLLLQPNGAHVLLGGTSDVQLLTVSGAEFINGGIEIQNSGGGNAFWISGLAGGNYLALGGTGGGPPALGAINIINSGNVGIGTTNTASKLDVNGNVSIGTSYSATAAPLDGLIVAGSVGIGTGTPTAGVALDLKYNTNSMLLPVGTTTQRPATGVNGMLRYNSTANLVEAYANGIWSSIASGSGGTPTCGTGCSAITSSPQSTDVRGSMTVTALATSAVVNFSTTLPSAPFCTCSGSLSTSVASCTNTTSAITANLSVGVTGDVITWQCPQ